MAATYSVLGQAAPSAATDTDVYEVPSATQAVVSTVVIANRSSSAGTYRIAVRAGGASISNEHYLAYDTPIDGNDSTTLTIGITLGAADVITAYCSSADMSINVFGSEIS